MSGLAAIYLLGVAIQTIEGELRKRKEGVGMTDRENKVERRGE